jgi:hypothetical protein
MNDVSENGIDPTIDRDAIRSELRRLGDEYIFYVLDEVIDLVPPDELMKIVGAYVDPERLRFDVLKERTVLEEARAFDTASRAGKYYESFDVDSRTYTNTSIGTRSFIADCRRLLNRCVREAPTGDALEIRDAITIALDLLRHIDECRDDVIFFADEGGAWQVGIDSVAVLSALFLCLSRTMAAHDYARRVVAIVNGLEHHEREKHLDAARRIGTSAHRDALASLVSTAPPR